MPLPPYLPGAADGITLIDEIYLGLSYEAHFGHTALAMPGELGQSIISINSFSKYFNMTGWRLGWLVVPEALVPVIERAATNSCVLWYPSGCGS